MIELLQGAAPSRHATALTIIIFFLGSHSAKKVIKWGVGCNMWVSEYPISFIGLLSY